MAKRQKLLIVDDHAELRTLIHMTLEYMTFNFTKLLMAPALFK
ncbi:chemotaxis protein CheY [Methylophaga thiooxydans]|uniref:Chemotaxis protein CheY n=1 Tax=Methylophaga thiooxydans TaxID=392484 RepID=A0A0A0BIX2_9GAMM|nr:chemotaxis protein CheY [Methylophaga thiooxydans]